MTTTTAPDGDPRRIEYRPLSELKANPRNPKSHNLDLIDSSLGRFGFVDPIAVDGRTGFIISGHGRTATLRAMRERGESAPDGVRLAPDGEWLVPVAAGWSSRTDSEASAALIALNRTTELGGWVDESLLELLEELEATGADDALDGVGFGEKEIEDLRAALEGGEGEDGGAPGAAGLLEAPEEDSYREQYAVTVICADEAEQERVYSRLVGMGLTVKVVTV